MLKVLTIVGARPQFIKAAPVSRILREAEKVTECIVHTGQHFDVGMSDIFFEELDVPAPHHHLGIHGGGHGAMTGAMLQSLEPLLEAEKPDYVLVYGDTNSTLAAALAATKLHIPVAHVEAGLRSFNRRMPEEVNRILTDEIADVLFTPTSIASENLRQVGVAEHRIQQVGDVMFDAALFYAERAANRSSILDWHGLSKGEYVLATVHRAENTDDGERLVAIMKGLDAVAVKRPVIFPLHPRTRAALERVGFEPPNIQFIDPVGYLDMVALESNAAVIATDSGGVQKEAFFYSVPCVTLRDETEWVELVEMGWNRLVAADAGEIATAVCEQVRVFGSPGAPYGDGTAATKIADFLRDRLQ